MLLWIFDEKDFQVIEHEEEAEKKNKCKKFPIKKKINELS